MISHNQVLPTTCCLLMTIGLTVPIAEHQGRLVIDDASTTTTFAEDFSTTDFQDETTTTAFWNLETEMLSKKPLGTIQSAVLLSSTLPVGRYDAASVYIPETDKAYIFGGEESYYTPSDSIIEFDPQTEVATLLSATLPEIRVSSSAAYVPELHRIYIFGGTNTYWMNSVFSFDVLSKTTARAGTLPHIVSNATTFYAPDQHKIFLLSGITDSSQNSDIVAYDPFSETSQLLEMRVPFPVDLSAVYYSSNQHVAHILGGGSSPIWLWEEGTPLIMNFDTNLGRPNTTEKRLPFGMVRPSWGTAPDLDRLYLFSVYHNQAVIFTPSTGDIEVPTVTLPMDAGQYFASGIYVSSTHTFYQFGGYSGSGSPTQNKSIMRVSLLPYQAGSAIAQSKRINGLVSVISATLTVTQHVPSGQTVNYYLSNTGGATWDLVTPGVPNVFASPGSDLRWRAVLSGSQQDSPEIDALEILYTSSEMTTIKRYLPLTGHFAGLAERPNGIYGQITYDASPIGGITVSLQLISGTTWSPVATATTRLDGFYVFTSAVSLQAGQSYAVQYGPTESETKYLYAWYSRQTSSYTAGQNVHIADFDIANVKLVSPNTTQALGMPITFRWVPRMVEDKTYSVRIFGPGGFAYYFGPSNDGQYILQSPPFLNSCWTDCHWDVWADTEWGTGVSNQAFPIKWPSWSQKVER